MAADLSGARSLAQPALSEWRLIGYVTCDTQNRLRGAQAPGKGSSLNDRSADLTHLLALREDPANKIIFLVEDNPEDEFLTTRSLKKSGIKNEIVVARDGQEALDWLFREGVHAERDAKLDPQVILLDLKLPKLSGLEVLKRIKEDERVKHIPVVILTSSKEESDIAKSYEYRANSYVQKPVNSQEAIMTQLGLYWLRINEPVTGK